MLFSTKEKKRADLSKIVSEAIFRMTGIMGPSRVFVASHNDPVMSGNWFMAVVNSTVARRAD
jgi:hypothetical protein